MSFREVRIGETDTRRILNGNQVQAMLSDYAKAAARRNNSFWGKGPSVGGGASGGSVRAVLRQKPD